MSILWCATMMTLPSPRSPVNHSPTTAPMTESGTAILKRGEDVRERAGNTELDEDLRFARVEESKEVQRGGIDRPESDEGIDHDREEGDEGGDHHLWERSEAKPNHKKRGYGDYRSNLDEQSDGVDGSLEEPGVGHDSRCDDGDQGSQSKAAE